MRNLLVEYNTTDEGHAIVEALHQMGYRKLRSVYPLFEEGGYIRTTIGEIAHGPKHYISGFADVEKATFKVSMVRIVVPERQVVIEGKSYDLTLVEEALRGVPFKAVE